MGDVEQELCNHDFIRDEVISGRRVTQYTKRCVICHRRFGCSEAEWEELPEVK